MRGMHKKVRTYDALPAEAKMIRKKVFMEEQGFENEFDDIDAKAVHIVIFLDEAPAGTCRLYQKDERNWIIGRVAVLKAYRKEHLGSLLLEAAEKEASARGAESLALASQVRAEGFYEKSGFHAYGKTFEDEGCPHIWMRKVLR